MDHSPVAQDPSTFELLPHASLNAGANATILFVHGAFGDRDDWNLVTPYLADYHLLIPDLPEHGASQQLTPFSPELSARLISKLIEEKGIGGVAHVVGLSLGASISLCLAATHQHVVKSVVVSGYGRLPRSALSSYLPYAIWTESRIEHVLPRSLISWLTDGADMRRVDLKTCNIDLIRRIFVDTMSTDGWPSPWPARTLVIAATKRGIIPSNDNTRVAQEVAKIGQVLNQQTVAVEHPAMRHGWLRKDGKLFAATVRAWIEETDLPADFNPLLTRH